MVYVFEKVDFGQKTNQSCGEKLGTSFFLPAFGTTLRLL